MKGPEIPASDSFIIISVLMLFKNVAFAKLGILKKLSFDDFLILVTSCAFIDSEIGQIGLVMINSSISKIAHLSKKKKIKIDIFSKTAMETFFFFSN